VGDAQVLQQAIDELLGTLEKRPDKDQRTIWADLLSGRRPSIPPVALGRQADPEDKDDTPVGPAGDSPEAELARGLRGKLRALKFGNQVSPAVGVGIGTSTLATAFGVEVRDDIQGAPPTCHIPLREFDGWDVPDADTAGCMPAIRDKIAFYRRHLPPDIKIGYPDMQGPFNIAHIILGSEIFYAFTDEPERLHRLMQLITDFSMRVYDRLKAWIGPDYMLPYMPHTQRIAECSCNTISKDTYREFVKPYDTQLGAYHGELGIHPCSGPHVFEVTLDELPHVRYTECGIVDCAFAGSIDVDKAIKRIGGRSIILSCGQELKPGVEETTIKNHLARLRDLPMMTFGYTGMYWKKRDDPEIIALRQRLDRHYMETYA